MKTKRLQRSEKPLKEAAAVSDNYKRRRDQAIEWVSSQFFEPEVPDIVVHQGTEPSEPTLIVSETVKMILMMSCLPHHFLESLFTMSHMEVSQRKTRRGRNLEG